MAEIDFGSALRSATGADPSSIPAVLARAAAEIAATDLVVYLVDFGRTELEPLPDQTLHVDVPVTEAVATTMAGRAYVEQRLITAERSTGARVWAPIIEGSDHTGVVAVTVADADDRALRMCEELGLLAGFLIAAQARVTDFYSLYRRRRHMSLAASMQWDLLPPPFLTTGSVTVAGTVEPAYDVGGDSFDYAANGPTLDFAVMDAMGHGVGSAVTSALALGCYRQQRREGVSLVAIHEQIGTAVETHGQHSAFVTGLLGRLDTVTGDLTLSNAGHPLPLLIRAGRVVGEIECDPTPPWGTFRRVVAPVTEPLEPGDQVLVYTDGVTEARTPAGEPMGLERLVDLVDRSVSEHVRPSVFVRTLVRSVCEHRGGDLADDATILVVGWTGERLV